MKNSIEEIQKLLTKAEASINLTAQLEQAKARLEATLTRKEIKKVDKKSKKHNFMCQEVSNF
tara:strand:- start:302 stop:487 length:186 start_codon:yes stop_codon:yes gene_type:complete